MDLIKTDGPTCEMCWTALRWPSYVCNQCGETYGETTDPALEECECGGNYEPPQRCATCASIGEAMQKARKPHG